LRARTRANSESVRPLNIDEIQNEEFEIMANDDDDEDDKDDDQVISIPCEKIDREGKTD
jgi:hypothetical protein